MHTLGHLPEKIVGFKIAPEKFIIIDAILFAQREYQVPGTDWWTAPSHYHRNPTVLLMSTIVTAPFCLDNRIELKHIHKDSCIVSIPIFSASSDLNRNMYHKVLDD